MLCSNCHREVHAGIIDLSKHNLIQFNETLIPKKIKKKYYCSCGKEKSPRASKCFYCHNKFSPKGSDIVDLKDKNRRIIYKRPDKKTIEKLLSENKSISEIGRGFGVSHGIVQKWIKYYKISHTTKKHEKIKCKICGTETSNKKYCCEKCKHIGMRKSKRPSREELLEMLKTMTVGKIEKLLEVSHGSIYKWLKYSGAE